MSQLTPAQKVMRVGDRFGRWTVLEMKGDEAHCLCDCGTKKSVRKYNLKKLTSSSCGCYRSEVSRDLCLKLKDNPEATQKMAETIRKRHEEGYYETSNKQNGERLSELNKGRPASGRCAKGEGNHIAKHWRVRSPSGVIIEGLSLRHLVRENAHMFSKADVEFRKNKYGTDLWSRADMGIRALFKPKKPIGSWKGWTRA